MNEHKLDDDVPMLPQVAPHADLGQGHGANADGNDHDNSGIRSMEVVSGGAPGADSEWTRVALQLAWSVKVMSFEMHKAVVPAVHQFPTRKPQVVRLDMEQLLEMDADLKTVARALRRNLPQHNAYIMSLLRRNIWIARHATAVLAVGQFTKARVAAPGAWQATLGLDGGTAYACEHFARTSVVKGPLDVWVLVNTTWWRAQKCLATKRYAWKPLAAGASPTLPAHVQNLALVGSRKLRDGQPALMTHALQHIRDASV